MANNLNAKLRDPKWLQEMKNKDALMLRRKAFYLPSGIIGNTAECHTRSCLYKGSDHLDQSISTAFESMSVSCKKYPMLICFSCDRTFHCVCVGITTEKLKVEPMPWICPECTEREDNEHARDYYASNKWKAGMAARRKQFVSLQLIKENSSLLQIEASDDELDPVDESAMNAVLDASTSHDKSYGSIGMVPVSALNQQRKEMLDLNENFEKERGELLKQIDVLNKRCHSMEKEKDEMKKLVENVSQRLKVFEDEKQQRDRNSKSTSQIIPSNVLSSTCVAPPILTVKEILAQRYLHQTVTNTSLNADAMDAGSSQNTATVVPQPDVPVHSLIGNNLNASDSILLEQIETQREATKAQRDVSDSMILDLKRKSLPKITRFSGDAKDWIRFKRDVQRYQEVGKFDEGLMKMYVLQSLEGVALERVQDIIDTASFQIVMNMLEEGFGEPSRIIDKCAEEIIKLKLDHTLYREDAMLINTKIQAYFSACIYANISYANSNHLARHIFDQLSAQNKLFFRRHFRAEHPNEPNKLIDLESMFAFLEDLSRDLEDKKKFDRRDDKSKQRTANVLATAVVGTSAPRGNDDYMYEIRDKATAIYIGYNMNAVHAIARRCECCKGNQHYTIQCGSYRSLDDDAKLKLMKETGLCKNCMITTSHKSNSCNVKASCGFRVGNSRCTMKHHISLHKILSSTSTNQRNRARPNRRNQTNSNTKKAHEIIAQMQQTISNETASSGGGHNGASSQSTLAPSIHQLPKTQSNRVYGYNSTTAQIQSTTLVGVNLSSRNECQQVMRVGSGGLQRTVKVFKNKFLGSKATVVGYSVGDSAAELTLLSEKLRKTLGIDGTPTTLCLQWTDNSVKHVHATRVDLRVRGIHKRSKDLLLRNCYAVEDFDLPPRSLDMEVLKRQFPHLEGIKFESYKDVSPQLLIGSPHASVIEGIGKLYEDGEGKPVGLLAKLGYCVYGGCPDEYAAIPYCIQSVGRDDESPSHQPENAASISNEELFEIFSFFSSVESLGIAASTPYQTENERKAIQLLEKEMIVRDDGYVEVPLVWDMDGDRLPCLPDNLPMVLKRQTAHEAKLLKNPEMLKAFNENIEEWLRGGEARPATDADIYGDWPNISYLPVSLVVNANKVPVKYRNVFDASAKYGGTSLNDNLLRGPDLLVNLINPLLRMRENRIAFTADIKSMFMRVKVSPRDQQLQRFLFRKDPNDDFRVYIMSSMLFGPSCSPFVSQFVKNKTADKWQDKYPEASETIKNWIYMDDLLSSEPTVSKAITIAKQCIDIFQSINWHLVAFQSNSLEFMKALPEANVKRELIPLLEKDSEACTTKVLGCMWNPYTDCYEFQFDKNAFIKIVKEFNHLPTKRDQSSTIARIFDALGLIAHFIIRGKILLQRSWFNGLGWDDMISEAEHKNWMCWLNDIEKVAKLKIPRMYADIDCLSDSDSIEIHTFCDAGKEAFATVSYMVVISGSKRESNIIMAKARVTPLRLKENKMKICEMPRLELYAALIAARLTDTIVKAHSKIKCNRFIWSDSEVVLRWILNPNQELPKYAPAPVSEILEKTQRTEWRYVPTQLNVADIATKFTKFDFSDPNSVWFRGPEFIRKAAEHWPVMPNLENVKALHFTMVCNTNVKDIIPLSPHRLPAVDCPLASDQFVDKFSSSIKYKWSKLVRATARSLKLLLDGLVPLVRSKRFNDKETREIIKRVNEGFRHLSASDYERAELFLIRKAQREAMPEIYKKLKNKQPIMDEDLKQLSVFIDEEGVIRINSRVNLSTDIYPQRFAPFIPRKSELTRTLLLHYHHQFNHICIESQVAAVRSKFWIPQLRTALNSIKANCNLCSLRKAKPYAPMMAPLPDFRVDPKQKPFEVTGLDCAGPIRVRMHTATREVYILIFTCTLTRFIHLHLLDSLQSIKVLEAIALFWTCHGPVRTFISDNGRNFTGAGRFLKEQNDVLGGLIVEKYRCDWKFIPAHSPWFGGFYERLIKEVKRAIGHVLENKKLQKIELNIALQDAAHRLNCRPLTHNPVNAEDGPVLTPHHLAKHKSGYPTLPGLPTPASSSDPKHDGNIYTRGRMIADAIMRKFVNGYLPLLTKRTKWLADPEPLRVGDLVLIIEPNQTRREWQRGRITKVYKAKDKRTRVADVLRHDGVLKIARSVQRLAKIQIKQIENAN